MGDDRTAFERVAAAHQLSVAWTLAQCSCGEWVYGTAEGEGPEGAMPAWAAHVHVAAGLAEEEDRRANEPGTSVPTIVPPAWGGMDTAPEEWTASERAFIEAGATVVAAVSPRRLRSTVERGGAVRYFMA